MHKKYKLIVVVASLVVIFDQLVKIYVDNSMRLHQSIEVVENFLNITYIRNRGAAFGMFAGVNESYRVPFFLVVTFIAICVILFMVRSYKDGSFFYPFSLALILGGALGNMIDRVRMGEVIDYIDVHWYQHHWPAFNVADSAISVGVAFLFIHMFTVEKGGKEG